MMKFYQKEWFGIDFKSFSKLDSKEMADISFYNKFYEIFCKRFTSFEDLPCEWRSEKKSIADFILERTDEESNLLSIGCGNGYVEYLLERENRNIVAIEPSVKATRLLQQFSKVKLYNGFFPECMRSEGRHFDLLYINTVEYCLDEEALLKLLMDAKSFSAGTFLLISPSIRDGTLLLSTKSIIKHALSLAGLHELGQFWGYIRTPDEIRMAFKRAGFAHIEDGFFKKDFFWIRGT